MSQVFGEELLGTLSYERSKAWSSFFKNCLDKDDGEEIEFNELGELFQPEDEANNDPIAQAEEEDVKDDLNKSTQYLTNTELTLLLCRGDQNETLSQTLPIMEEHERKWKQAGLDRILNTFDAEKIEHHVGGWLRRHNSRYPTAETPHKLSQVCSSSHSTYSDAESMHSMDTARYIRASRKRNVSTGTKSTSSLTTIKMYRTLPRKRAELHAKYACQADELHEEQQHLHHMQSLLHRRIREYAAPRERHRLLSGTSVSFNGQQRRKKLRKRRYTSPAAAASSSSSSSEDCVSCRKRSYRIYSYHSEFHCQGSCLPAPWLNRRGAKWVKRKTSPALEQQPVPRKICKLESEASEESLNDLQTVNIISGSPESIQQKSDSPERKHSNQSNQLQFRDVSDSSSAEKQLQLGLTQQSDSSGNSIINKKRKQSKKQMQVLESDDSISSLHQETTTVDPKASPSRSPANESNDSSDMCLSVSRRMKKNRKQSHRKASSSQASKGCTDQQYDNSQISIDDSSGNKEEQKQSHKDDHQQLTDSTRLNSFLDLQSNVNRSIKQSKNLRTLDSDVEQSAPFVITAKGILLHKPSGADLCHDSKSSNAKFVLSEEVMRPIIGRRKAIRFMKYHTCGCSYDSRLHIYYRPSAEILAKLRSSAVSGDLNSSSCSESSDDIFEMLGRYGSITATSAKLL
ncbi:hypothetical protein KR044_006889 [Drosophila immigrans]|nr:hypothetical protein KR044_006889 [Drosophila immigrans]